MILNILLDFLGNTKIKASNEMHGWNKDVCDSLDLLELSSSVTWRQGGDHWNLNFQFTKNLAQVNVRGAERRQKPSKCAAEISTYVERQQLVTGKIIYKMIFTTHAIQNTSHKGRGFMVYFRANGGKLCV